jgi:hypothetical protein
MDMFSTRMDALKPVLTRYVEITKKLNELNRLAGELRDERRTIELDLAAVYGTTREDLPEKIELTGSKMVFVVKKPNEWKKGWTMSKKELEAYLAEILPEHGEDVMREIIMRHSPKLVGDDFQFELRKAADE